MHIPVPCPPNRGFSCIYSESHHSAHLPHLEVPSDPNLGCHQSLSADGPLIKKAYFS